MATVTDPYKTLGVDKKASDEEVKKAYRKLARRWHPDTNPDDPAAEERFKEIQEANAILSDPEKRKQYDSGGGIFGGRGGAPGGAGVVRGGEARGRDLEVEVHLSFAQAMEGPQIPVTVPMQAPCHTCRGTGARPGTSPSVCPRCQGRGIEAPGEGLLPIPQPRSEWGGTGTKNQ